MLINTCSHKPEEDADSSSAGKSMCGACTHILSFQLGLTAVALGAQHGTAHQTQSRSARLIPSRFRTPRRDQDQKIRWFIESEAYDSIDSQQVLFINRIWFANKGDSREAGGLVNQGAVVTRQLYEMIGLSRKSETGNGRMVSTWVLDEANSWVMRSRTDLMRATLLWRPCSTPGWEHHLHITKKLIKTQLTSYRYVTVF